MNSDGVSDRWSVLGAMFMFYPVVRENGRIWNPTLRIFVVIPFISHRRSNDVGIKCLSLSLCAFLAEDSLSEENRIGAIHILGFTNLISHSPFTFFSVNCAL